MIVTLDGRRLSDTYPPQSTLQNVIDAVRSAGASDRLIVSVAVNGQRLSDAELNTSLAQPLATDAQVDLESGDRDTLVRDALRGLALEFADAHKRLPEVGAQLTSGDISAALQDVSEFVSLWQTCYRALAQCTSLLERDLLAFQHDGQTVKSYLETLIAKLGEVRAALEAHDTVTLADLVRYEFVPLTETWQRILADLADQAVPAPATA